MRQKDIRQAAAIVLILPLFSAAKQSTAEHARLEPGRAVIGVRSRLEHRWRDPYVAEWSDHQGDRLIINGTTIKFGNDKPVPYRDITRVTNGREFNLEVTLNGKPNYLTTFLHVSFGAGDKTDQMKVTIYDSRKDMESGENSQGEAVWYREK